MSPTRLLILGIGFVAAIVAAVLVVNLTSTTGPETIRQVVEVPTIKTTKILIADKRLNRGDAIKSGSLRWAEWPSSSVTKTHITQSAKPDALKEFIGDTVRLTMEQGDPAQTSKFVKQGQGFMAAVLEKGKRAVSTNVSPGTAAGGFILPDDRVDVMMTRAVDIGIEGAAQSFDTVPVLRNVRVLAIDQQIQEKDGEPVVVGKTATLELTDEQVRILTVTQQVADSITLALRSIRDSEEPVSADGAYLISGTDGSQKNKISIVRHGKVSAVKTDK